MMTSQMRLTRTSGSVGALGGNSQGDPATHLRQTNTGGYRWSNKHLGMPKRIAQAASDPECCAAVNELRGRS